jgi:hypothetical protein
MCRAGAVIGFTVPFSGAGCAVCWSFLKRAFVDQDVAIFQHATGVVLQLHRLACVHLLQDTSIKLQQVCCYQ